MGIEEDRQIAIAKKEEEKINRFYYDYSDPEIQIQNDITKDKLEEEAMKSTEGAYILIDFINKLKIKRDFSKGFDYHEANKMGASLN